MKTLRTRLMGLVLSLALALLLALLGPPEHTLGPNIRTVYLHGAWVWASLAAFGVAAGLGLFSLLTRAPHWQAQSRAWGRAGCCDDELLLV